MELISEWFVYSKEVFSVVLETFIWVYHCLHVLDLSPTRLRFVTLDKKSRIESNKVSDTFDVFILLHSFTSRFYEECGTF